MQGDDLLVYGWNRIDVPTADDPIYPFIEEGDVFALWLAYDRADDLLHLVDLIVGGDCRRALICVMAGVLESAIHVHARRPNRADFFIRFRDESLYERRDVPISPELREMIETAATGDI